MVTAFTILERYTLEKLVKNKKLSAFKHFSFWQCMDTLRDKEILEKNGFIFSGVSPDGLLPEIIEISDHPWFIGVQFHPELKSKPFSPHPLFADFIKAALMQSRLV